MNKREWITGLVLLALLPVAAVSASVMGEVYYVNLATRVAIVALAAVGLNFALGFGGLVSFGHAAFFGLGGYVAGIAAHHAFDGSAFLGPISGTTSMPVIWGVAALVCAIVAMLIGTISLRTSGVYFIMITLAFAQMIYYFAISFPAYGGQDGLPIYLRNTFPGVNADAPLVYFAISLTALIAALALSARIMGSGFGAALTMARMNPTRLATSGIEPRPVHLRAFVISAVITGLAGALFADLNGFVGPSMLDWHRSGEIMVIVILGGTGRLFGPVAGAILFIALEVLIGGVTDHWQFFLGLILLSVVLFARGGLIGVISGRGRND